MRSKNSLYNIQRAVDYMVSHGACTHKDAMRNLRHIKYVMRGKLVQLDKIKNLAGHGDLILGKYSGLNTDKLYRVFKRDYDRYSRKTIDKVRFYELVLELYENFCMCRTHMTCGSMDNMSDLPGYSKDIGNRANWFVWTDCDEVIRRFKEDSHGKVLDSFTRYVYQTMRRHPRIYHDATRSIQAMVSGGVEQNPVQAMVYTGKFHRHYPVVLMMKLHKYGESLVYVDNKGNVDVLPSDWVVMMVKRRRTDAD